jgi:hypothetical protein
MAATVPTWEATRVDLARRFATVHGYTARSGGWIYRPDGVPVAHGWAAFADRLVARGWIREGVGIDWARAALNPNLTRATRKATR